MLCFVETTLADQMPRRFRGEEKDWEEESGPDPLDCEGDFVGPFSGVVDEAFENAGGDELADDEAPGNHLVYCTN